MRLISKYYQKCIVDTLTKVATDEKNYKLSGGLLCKKDRVTLPKDRSLAISRMISLEKKFGRLPHEINPTLCTNQRQ